MLAQKAGDFGNDAVPDAGDGTLVQCHEYSTHYDDNQHAADENLRIQNLWNGIETYAALLAGLGAKWGVRPTP